MILIPMGTDAPIYHWPYATVGMMVLNLALFFAVPSDRSHVELDENDEVVATAPTTFDRYSLTLGDGLHPTQWLTHNFLHNDLFHLIGNLIFLWAFGIVVEGKLGPFKYLLLYLAIGVLHGALSQSLLLRSGLTGGAVGASAIVFGLLSTCMIWAPRNELNCLMILIFGFRVFVRQFEVYFTTVALFYFGEQIIGLGMAGLTGRAMVSEMGHLSGGFWGAVIAVLLLRAKLVDCEGWDLFSILAKRRQLARDWNARGQAHDRNEKGLKKRLKAQHSSIANGPETPPEERSAAAVRKVRKLIAMGDTAGAVASYDKAARTLVSWPPQPDLYDMIKGMIALKAESEAIRMMRDHCRYYPGESVRLRLKLAQILISARQRPTAALRVLAEIPADSLPPDLETARLKLRKQALRMQEEGVLELEDDD